MQISRCSRYAVVLGDCGGHELRMHLKVYTPVGENSRLMCQGRAGARRSWRDGRDAGVQSAASGSDTAGSSASRTTSTVTSSEAQSASPGTNAATKGQPAGQRTQSGGTHTLFPQMASILACSISNGGYAQEDRNPNDCDDRPLDDKESQHWVNASGDASITRCGRHQTVVSSRSRR
jgi:hypothetical protein